MSEIVKTACGICPFSCGMDVELEEGKIVRVSGMKEHPVNKGRLCPKGAASVEYVYSQDRLKYPLKRKNGGWSRISWDDALDIISNQLEKIGDKYGRKSFAVLIGMPVLLAGFTNVGFIERFCDVYGSPNCFSPESMCFRIRFIGQVLTTGTLPSPDPENAQCIIVWGNNPHASNPMIAEKILNAQKNGAKLIVIDPMKIPLSKGADLHLQPRPGTDGALILGMLQVIISEGLYDSDFVKRWTVGFEQLAQHTNPYSLEKVEGITWIPGEKIQKAARLFASGGPSCIVQGTNALDQHSSGFQNQRGITILQAITGNIDIPGGFISPDLGGPPSMTGVAPTRLPDLISEMPLGADKYPLFFEAGKVFFGEGQGMSLYQSLINSKPYPIKSMIISGANPLLTWPNTEKMEAALKNLEFLAVMDIFMTRTAQMADLVLPASTFLERTDFFEYGIGQGLPYVILRKKVIQYQECWQDLKFWLKLAQQTGYQKYFPWETVEEVLDYVLKPTGLSVAGLKEKPEGIKFGRVKFKAYEEKGFPTPSGKVEIYSKTLKKMGYDPLPTYIEPKEGPKNDPETFKEYPLILTTGARILEYPHSQMRNIGSLKKRFPEPLVEINPITAERYGIKDGEKILVETKRGSIEIKSKVTENILKEVINISHGWEEANVNFLTDEFSCDPVSGYPGLKSLLCRIKKVEGG